VLFLPSECLPSSGHCESSNPSPLFVKPSTGGYSLLRSNKKYLEAFQLLWQQRMVLIESKAFYYRQNHLRDQGSSSILPCISQDCLSYLETPCATTPVPNHDPGQIGTWLIARASNSGSVLVTSGTVRPPSSSIVAAV
jgi:hypothetical protein